MNAKKPTLFLCAWALAAPAMAQDLQVCASAGHLMEGVVVSYENGGTDTFKRDVRDPAVVVLEAELAGERMGLVRRAHGYIDLSVLGPHGESVVFDYGMLPAEMPKPESGTAWEVVATVTTPEGAATERQMFTYGTAGSLTIRDCQWEIVPVTLTLSDHVQESYFFPAIGIAVPAGEDIREITPLVLMP